MATFSGTTTTGIVLANPATQNPLTVTSSGLVDVSSTTANAAGILGNPGFPWTIVNQGTIKSIGSLGVGIYLNSGGLVTNGPSGAANALIDGDYAGLVISGASGTVVNYGTIEGASGSSKGILLTASGAVSNRVGGLIEGMANGVSVYSPTGSASQLFNQGTIVSLGSAVVNGVPIGGTAVYFQAGGILQNGVSGSTGGLIEAYHFGIVTGTAGSATTIVNFGTINILEQAPVPAGMGIQLHNGGTVANFGTIAALGRGGGVGVQLIAGGFVQNGTSGATSATIEAYGHAIGAGFNVDSTLVNFGTLASIGSPVVLRDSRAAVLFHYGGNITNFGLILGVLDGVWTGVNSTYGGVGTITNLGTIVEQASFQNPLYPQAVFLGGGGTVTNGESGVSGALIAAGWNAILSFKGPGTVRNFGTIESLGTTLSTGGFGAGAVILADGGLLINGTTGATTALIEAYRSPVYVGGYRSVTTPTAVGTVVNFGTIEGIGSAIAASSIALVAGGTVVNYGLIASASSNGVSVSHAAGTLTNFATIQSTATVGAGVYLQSGGVISNMAGATISAKGAAVSLAFSGTTSAAATVVNTGVLVGGTGIAIGAGDSAANTIVNTGTIIGTAGTAISLGTVGNALVVLGSASSLQGVVANMVVGDVFDLPFLTFSSSGTATLGANNVLNVVEPGGMFSIALDPNQSFAGDVFTTSSDSGGGTLVTEEVACFCRGTLILTARGETAVEDLAIGDRVVTLSGRLEPIKWIGRRAYDGRFIAGNRVILPVHIAAGALADGRPARDLRLSPEHALYIDGVLVAVRLLVNGTTICQEEWVEHLEYFHVELESHDVLLAEAVPVESYVECDNRGMFQNAGGFALLYPDDRRSRRFCAPRLEVGASQLAVIRALCDARAKAGSKGGVRYRDMPTHSNHATAALGAASRRRWRRG